MKTNFSLTFTGAQFAPKREKIVEGAEGAADTVIEVVETVCGEMLSSGGYEQFKNGFSAVAQPGPFILDLLRKLTGMESAAEITLAIGPNVLTGFFESVAPFYGVISSSAKSIQHFYKAVNDLKSSMSTLEALPAVQADAGHALVAVAQLLKRRSNDQFAQGAVKAVESVVNGALIGSGYGAVATSGVSLGAKIATLAVIIRRRALEYKEVQKGKLFLASPANLSPKAFETCPLLGCYLLTNSDTSNIVMSCFVQGVFVPNWMKEVEKNKKQLDPIIAAAREFIGDSVFELRGPGLTTRATASDQRPWIETFWISRFGATGNGYRAITTGLKARARVESGKEMVLDSMRVGLRKTLSALLAGNDKFV